MNGLTARLAALYDAPQTAPAMSELRMFKMWIDSEFERIPATVRFVQKETTLAATVSRYINTGELVISNLYNYHPYLKPAENSRFRAVHDWHHIIGGVDDTLTGEICSYIIARHTAPKQIWWILFSEIVLQAAACIHHGGFQRQKMVKVV